MLPDLCFDAEITGFDMAEIDTIIDDGDIVESGLERVHGKGTGQHRPDAADAFEEPVRDRPADTRPGMIWALGEHRLLCGDSTKAESYDQLLGVGVEEGREVVDLVFTDRPYNVCSSGCPTSRW